MKVITGDLFSHANLDAIGHGVNCYGAMGAGIAVQFKKLYPQMYREYAELCKAGKLVPGQCFAWQCDDDSELSYIYNLASQRKPGADARYEWLVESLQAMVAHAEAHDIRTVGLPMIGAGIGGLTPDETINAMRAVDEATDIEIVLVQFDG